MHYSRYLEYVAKYEYSQPKEPCDKLDWNECLEPPSEKVQQAISSAARFGNFYPDLDAITIRTALERYTGVDRDWIRVFNGSDDALRCLCDVFLDGGATMARLSPSYSQIDKYATINGSHVLRASNMTKLLYLLGENEIDLVYLVSPNNPTGEIVSYSVAGWLCKTFPFTMFVVDEAYFEFCGETCDDLIGTIDNLAIVRTFSKAFGMAGIRLGYVMTSQDVVLHLDKVRNGKDVSRISQAAGIAALDDLPSMHSYVDRVNAERTLVVKQLRDWGYDVINTPANFVLVWGEHKDKLSKRGIAVRQLSEMPGWTRVTIGPDMSGFLEAMR